jgi:anti-anti-sigma factor
MEVQNEIKIERRGDVTLLDVSGEVNRFSKPFFRDAYAQVDSLKTKKILLKFDEMTYFNSEGIKVLIQLLAETNRNQQQVGIVGLSDHFKKIFRMVGITKFAKVFGSVKEAMEGLCGSTENSESTS